MYCGLSIEPGPTSSNRHNPAHSSLICIVWPKPRGSRVSCLDDPRVVLQLLSFDQIIIGGKGWSEGKKQMTLKFPPSLISPGSLRFQLIRDFEILSNHRSDHCQVHFSNLSFDEVRKKSVVGSNPGSGNFFLTMQPEVMQNSLAFKPKKNISFTKWQKMNSFISTHYFTAKPFAIRPS